MLDAHVFMSLAILLVSGIGAGTLSLNRGRDPVFWTLTGFVVGPIAFAVAALPERKKRQSSSIIPRQ